MPRPPVNVKTSLQGKSDVIEQGSNLGVFSLEHIHEHYSPDAEELRHAVESLPEIKMSKACKVGTLCSPFL